MNKFKENIIIGLEVHVEAATNTKLFCSCPTHGSDEPNTRTCEVCLGMPGSKPVLNKKAIEFAIKLCLALKCNISPELIFSRKSYFYPDMAKNYQISQYEIPLGKNGSLKIKNKSIGITRVHLEEDPASLVHPGGMQQSAYVLVDYNRSGDPLIEIVTEPELHSPEEAREFMNQLITILEYLDIFDINRCILKADANISIKESGYVRAEVKNITGFKEIERALKYEVERQKKDISEGKKIILETRSWDSEKGITFSLRSKETEEDYGYIIDPDLVKTKISKDMIEGIKKDMPELADEKLHKFLTKHKIAADTANILSKDKKMAEMFEAVASAINPELASKWIRRELARVLNYNKKTLDESGITPIHMIDLLKLVEENKITDSVASKILEKLMETPFDINDFVKNEKLEAVSDKGELEKFCKEAISGSQKAVEEFKAGNEKALNFIIGQVMKKTKGKATPKEVNEIIKKLINE
ncbi:MAG: Asp-tRNA(Asn)/Glu-tRNA(Gln) amidotransferase subunit GatB [Candidatus Woesearchaeota archaeon]